MKKEYVRISTQEWATIFERFFSTHSEYEPLCTKDFHKLMGEMNYSSIPSNSTIFRQLASWSARKSKPAEKLETKQEEGQKVYPIASLAAPPSPSSARPAPPVAAPLKRAKVKVSDLWDPKSIEDVVLKTLLSIREKEGQRHGLMDIAIRSVVQQTLKEHMSIVVQEVRSMMAFQDTRTSQKLDDLERRMKAFWEGTPEPSATPVEEVEVFVDKTQPPSSIPLVRDPSPATREKNRAILVYGLEGPHRDRIQELNLPPNFNHAFFFLDDCSEFRKFKGSEVEFVFALKNFTNKDFRDKVKAIHPRKTILVPGSASALLRQIQIEIDKQLSPPMH